MSINDPQWGNSHRPEQKEPDQAPDKAGAAPVQPESDGGRENPPLNNVKASPPQSSTPTGSQQSPTPTPPEGPPDLEVLWQQLVYRIRCRLAKILRQAPPELPTPPQSTAKQATNPPPAEGSADPLPSWQALSLQSWLIGVALLFGAWLMSGFYLVDANQRGVVSRFGVVSGTEEPGWHWRWPYPFESVRLVNVTGDRTLEIGAATSGRQAQGFMLTADQNLVGLSYAVIYQVEDPVAYLTRLDQPSDLLGVFAENAIREAVARQTLRGLQQSISKPDTDAVQSPALNQVRDQIQQSLNDLNSGIRVKNVLIRDVRLPGPVLQAVKQADEDAQSKLRAFRETQIAATDSLIKAYKLANQLQEESRGYGQVLDDNVTRLNAASAPDLAAAQKTVAALGQATRLQFPLLFDTDTDLIARTLPAKVAAKNATKASGSKAAAPVGTGAWRDRDIMRERDRVERPGSGS